MSSDSSLISQSADQGFTSNQDQGSTQETVGGLSQQLNLTTERLKLLILHLRDGILFENEHRRVELANHAFCSMFGIDAPPDALIGSDCKQAMEMSKVLFTEEHHFVTRVNEILRNRELVIGEKLELKDGRVFERDYVPIFVDSAYLGHLWQYRDLTQTVQSAVRQSRLLEIEKQHRNILDIFLNIPNVDQAIQEAITIAGTLLGVSRVHVFRFRDNERILDGTHEWCAPNIHPEINNFRGVPFDTLTPSLFPLLANAGIIATNDILSLPQDIQPFLERQNTLSILIVPIFTDARIDGFIAAHDSLLHRAWLPEEITVIRTLSDNYAQALERQRMQASLIEARDIALHSAEVKSQFVSNMSHEVRTPLTGVIGMLELMRESKLDEEQREFTESAFLSAQRLLDVLNDMLDFSKLESGQVVLNIGDLNLRDVLNEVKGTLTPLATRNRVNINIDIAEDVPAWVIGDVVRLRQVIMNLASNAVKFTSDGLVHFRIIAIGSKDKGKTSAVRLRFEVEDTGIGISPIQIDRIFESFVQADGSITRKFGGSGLGLAICKQLVEMMGGEIDVKSKLGVGSLFGFTLDFLPSARIESGKSKSAANQLSTLRVLLIDHDSAARYILAQQIRALGATVVELEKRNQLITVATSAAQNTEPFQLIFISFSDPLEMEEAIYSNLRRGVGLNLKRLIAVLDKPRLFDLHPNPFDSIIIRPITQDSLYELLTEALVSSDLKPKATQTVNQIPKRVLVADDNLDARILLYAVLNQLQVTVDVVNDGIQALQMLSEHSYQLALLDIQMPEMDGLEVIRTLRANPIYKSMPVVALTASVMNSEIQMYLAAGFNSVIAKPFKLDYVRQIVMEYLNRTDPQES